MVSKDEIVEQITERLRGVELTHAQAERIREAVGYSDRLPDED